MKPSARDDEITAKFRWLCSIAEQGHVCRVEGQHVLGVLDAARDQIAALEKERSCLRQAYADTETRLLRDRDAALVEVERLKAALGRAVKICSDRAKEWAAECAKVKPRTALGFRWAGRAVEVAEVAVIIEGIAASALASTPGATDDHMRVSFPRDACPRCTHQCAVCWGAAMASPAAQGGEAPWPPMKGDVWRRESDGREFTFEGTIVAFPSFPGRDLYESHNHSGRRARWTSEAFTDGTLTFVRRPEPSTPCETCEGTGWDQTRCKVCEARSDANGDIQHGRGCYQLDENVGGIEAAHACEDCNGTGVRRGSNT